MKILFVSSQALFRDTRFGGAKRLYYLARELESRAELHVVCLDSCGELPSGSGLAPDFRRMLFLPSAPTVSSRERFGFLPGIAGTLAAGRGALAAFLGETRFDATLLAFPSALHFLDRGLIPFPGKIVYLEDDLLLEQFRKHAVEASSPLRHLVKRWRYRQAVRFYRKNLERVSAFACISPQEADIVRKLHPELPVRLLGYGLPLEDYPVLPRAAGPLTLGFIGNYRHPPNVDAALWLTNDLFPAVRKEFPEARLILCGTHVPENIRDACGRIPAIQIMENVGDLSLFYGSIDVFVNPVREGRGLRTKVVEAAAFGRPVLSTPLGMEGLETFRMATFGDGNGLVKGLRALENPAEWRKTADHNRAIVEADFSMRAIGDTLMDMLDPERP